MFEMLTPHLQYSLKIWLTAVLLAPILVSTLTFRLDVELSTRLVFIGMSILWGFVMSIPCWLLLLFGTSSILNSEASVTKKRAKTQGLVLLLSCWLLFALFDQNGKVVDEWRNALMFPLSYIGILTFGVWFYNIENKNTIPQHLP
jgi:hypothetical protein